jgi:uncharacterized protein (TIGR02598 family)
MERCGWGRQFEALKFCLTAKRGAAYSRVSSRVCDSPAPLNRGKNAGSGLKNAQASPGMRIQCLKSGFSLVEVALAVGVVSFSLLPMVALLPTGLDGVRESANETALNGIVGKARAELNQAAWKDVSGTLNGKLWFFDESGKRLPDRASSPGAHYSLNFLVNSAQVTGAAPSFETVSRRVTLEIKYPVFAPAANQKTLTVALLAARQSSR